MLGNKETMANNIRRYMEKYGKSRNEVCKDLGFKYSTFSDWLNGKKYPRIDKIEMMANYFHVSKADLVEEEPYAHNLGHNSLSSDESELISNYQKLNAAGKSKVREYAADLTEQQKYMLSDAKESPVVENAS